MAEHIFMFGYAYQDKYIKTEKKMQ